MPEKLIPFEMCFITCKMLLQDLAHPYLFEFLSHCKVFLHVCHMVYNVFNQEKVGNLTEKVNRFESAAKKTKKILYFTPFFDLKDFGFGQKPFIERGCPVSNCFTTNNRSLLSKFEFNFQS